MASTRIDSAADLASSRRHYIDWLRVLMVLVVFAVHSAMPFNSASEWSIMNDHGSFAVTACIGFCYIWGMPLFFLLCGAGSRLSRSMRSSAQYIGERFKRLMIPYAAGLATLVPLQVYIEYVSKGRTTDSFFQFYPHYFEQARLGWNLDFGVSAHHLWFLRYLFVFSVIALPLFLWLEREGGRRLLAALGALCERRGAIFLFVMPVAAVQVALRAGFPEYMGWADYFYWFVFFVYGYLVAADGRIERAVARHGRMGLAVGILCFAAIAGLFQAGYVESWELAPTYSPGYLLYEVLCSVNTWAWLLAILYGGMRFLNFTNGWLRYANEVSMPFYVIHHPVVVAVAFGVVRWQAGIPVKLCAVVMTSFVLVMILYQFVIRPIGAFRFLVGVKPRRQPAMGFAQGVEARA